MSIAHDTRQALVSKEVTKYIHGFTHVLDTCLNIYVGTVGTNDVELITLEGEEYTELFQASPVWAPGKREGVFRSDDLWEFIDRKMSVEKKKSTNTLSVQG